MMKEQNILSEKPEEVTIPKKNPFLEKLSNIFFGLFITVLFTLPLWCILMIVVYFVNNRM